MDKLLAHKGKLIYFIFCNVLDITELLQQNIPEWPVTEYDMVPRKQSIAIPYYSTYFILWNSIFAVDSLVCIITLKTF